MAELMIQEFDFKCGPRFLSSSNQSFMASPLWDFTRPEDWEILCLIGLFHLLVWF